MYTGIFDSHAHYTDAAFAADRDALLTALPSKGVSCIMLAASDLESAAQGIALTERYPYLYAAVGIHPEEAGKAQGDYIGALRALTDHPKVKAVGEIGLDYHYEGYDRQAQLALLEAQLQLAADCDLPVILHVRDATGDSMEILRRYRPRGVMHCFSGSAETARQVLDLGLYIGFTGVLTFRNARRALEALAVIPMDRLLLETDCPYMAPEPYRGQRCDSSMIPRMAERVAAEKNLSPQAVLDQTRENAMRLFGISAC